MVPEINELISHYRIVRKLGGGGMGVVWLEWAYAQRDSGPTEMKGDFFLKSLERDPRYIAFLKKMRLPV